MARYHRLLIFILGFAALGTLMSGYLSYRNYFSAGCSQGPLARLVTCGGPNAVKIFEQPTCVYGLVMFMLVFVFALVGLQTQPSRKIITTLVVLGIAGTAFSGFLSIYEVWYLRFPLNPMPACVYGLLFYLGILISGIIAYRGLGKPATSEAPPPAPVM